MAIRLIAADLDGTLRVESKPFTPRVRDAVRRAQARGVHVVMSTGRMFLTAEPFARDLGLVGPIVCDHGATIRDLDTGEALRERRIPREFVRQIVTAVPGHMTPTACLDGEMYTMQILETAVRFAGPYAREHLHQVPDLANGLAGDPQKLVFINDADVSEQLLVDLTARFGGQLQVVQSFPLYVELTHREASKGKAVEWLASHWGVPRQEVMAIGDQGNDCSMIEWAGLGVAMGNAVASVKAIADWVAPSAQEDGAAVAIERFALGG